MLRLAQSESILRFVAEKAGLAGDTALARASTDMLFETFMELFVTGAFHGTEKALFNTTALQEVKALIPNLAAVSEAEATQLLREAALKELTAAAKEMETQIKEAEQRISQAQNGGSEADQQAAKQHLLQLRAEQTEKLKRIAARSRAQIETLQQLKAAP